MARFRALVVAVLLLPAEPILAALGPPRDPLGGEGRSLAQPDGLNAAERARIWRDVVAERRRRAGSSAAAVGAGGGVFALPLRQVALGYKTFHATGNFVDHDSDFPDELLDWNCGARTYDRPDGYNHSGTDLFGWPFAWWLMDRGRLEAIAPADGTLVAKQDGVFDRSCGCGSSSNNYLVLEHADDYEDGETSAWSATAP